MKVILIQFQGIQNDFQCRQGKSNYSYTKGDRFNSGEEKGVWPNFRGSVLPFRKVILQSSEMVLSFERGIILN
jgi:hypothetical protein